MGIILSLSRSGQTGKALSIAPITFGRLAIRSAYRSPEVNAYGNAYFQNCGANDRNRARHIWDQRSKDGGTGAMTSIVVP